MQVSILEGIYAGSDSGLRPSYPINMDPVISPNGLSDGYLRTVPGITQFATGPGQDWGSINWNGIHYRVMGTKLVSIDSAGVVTNLGDFGASVGFNTLDYGFDRIAIATSNKLFYWTGSALTQVTDPNLGVVKDVCWIDGYFMTTDGTYLVVTELADPMTVNPTKYGSSEADPDPILSIKRVRDEIYVLNANTIENFQNIGGTGFPFQRNPGGLIPKGVCGTYAAAYFLETFAFVGNGRNEALSVYLAGYGQATCISTPEVDRELLALGPLDRALLGVERIIDRAEQKLLVHLPTKTLVYHHQASLAAGKPVWTQLIGGVNLDQVDVGRNFVLVTDATHGSRWYCGDPSGKVGYLDTTADTSFGQPITGRFDTAFMYNGGNGAILKSAELFGSTTALAGTGYLSWTQDGTTWGAEQGLAMTSKRLQWRPKARMRSHLGLRFRFPISATTSFARLEVEAEPLNG